MKYFYRVRDICDETGLTASQVRVILAGHKATGKYPNSGPGAWISKGGYWSCSGVAFQEIFGGIVVERQRELVALADEQLAKAKAVIERRTWEARIRREQAEARREAVINTARARYRSATRTKCRKAAHYPLSKGALER